MVAEIRDILLRIRGDVGDAVSKLGTLDTSWVSLEAKVNLAKQALAAVGAISGSVFDGLQQGQKVQAVADGFETLQTRAGLLADDSLSKLRSATRGLVDDFALMQQANQAMLLGLDPDSFADLAGAATKLSAAMGRDIVGGIDSVVGALGRNSFELLDNLGITLRVEQAHKEYAEQLHKTTAQLTEQEKAEAFRVIAAQKVIEKAQQMTETQLSAGQAAQQLRTTFTNLTNQFDTSTNSSEALRDSLVDVNDALKGIDLRGVSELYAILLKISALTFGELIDFGKRVGNDLFDLTQRFNPGPIEKYSQAIKELAIAQDDLNRKQAENDASFVNPHGGLTREREKVELLKKEAEAAKGAAIVYRDALPVIADINKTYETFGLFLQKTTIEQGKAAPATGKTTEELKKQAEAAGKAQQAFESLSTWMSGEFGFAQGEQESLFGQFLYMPEEVQQDAYKKIEETAQKVKEEHERAYQSAANFYEEVMYGVIDGNLKDVLQNMLINAAVRWGAEMLAQAATVSVTQQGISLGGSLFGGGGAAGGIGGAAIPGGAAVGAGFWGGAALAGPGLALLASGQHLQTGYDAGSVSAGFDAAPWWAKGAGAIGGFWGGAVGSGKSGAQQQRDGYRGQLREMGVIDDSDSFALFGGGRGSLSPGGRFEGLQSGSEQFAGLGNILSIAQTGGVEEDLAAMFANALSEAESFNAAALTTTTLLESMGIDAAAAQDLIIAAYANGEISIEEFNATMNDSRRLALDDLGSIEEGVDLLADAIDGNPRDALKALQLTYKEFTDAGIQDTEGMLAVIQQKLGVDAERIFREMAAAGINQFTDFNNLSTEQLQFIFNKIVELQEPLADLGPAAREAGSEISSGLEPGIRTVSRLSREAAEARVELVNLKRAAA